MRKGFIFAGLLITFALSYLFYRSCKRDTLVIAPAARMHIPDSSWLHGSINLNQIKKDIAWSTFLNGDFKKIFQTDTNTLLKLFRSPDTYSITEQDSIRYFSVWKDSINYKGLIFALTNNAAIKQSFKSDSFRLNQQRVYSFRTREGFWMYDSSNLLLVSGPADSLIACRFFTIKDTTHVTALSDNTDTLDFSSDQSVLLSGHINTRFVPEAIKHPLLDSAEISFQVMSNNEMLDITFTYKGFLSTVFNQTSITHQNNAAAFFCAANLNAAGLKVLLTKIPAAQEAYVQQELLDSFLSAFNNNNASVEFNGWKKIKSSYYTSVLNDEFETVLQKKDSSIIEPIFKISLEQKNKANALDFLKYLQKEGLVSAGKQSPFEIIYGNFDSELSLNSTNTFIVHNKHTPEWTRTPGPNPIDAALLLTIKPAALKGLSDSKFETHPLFSTFEIRKQLNFAVIHILKEKDILTGSIKIKFTNEDHPFIALKKVVSGQ